MKRCPARILGIGWCLAAFLLSGCQSGREMQRMEAVGVLHRLPSNTLPPSGMQITLIPISGDAPDDLPRDKDGNFVVLADHQEWMRRTGSRPPDPAREKAADWSTARSTDRILAEASHATERTATAIHQLAQALEIINRTSRDESYNGQLNEAELRTAIDRATAAMSAFEKANARPVPANQIPQERLDEMLLQSMRRFSDLSTALSSFHSTGAFALWDREAQEEPWKIRSLRYNTDLRLWVKETEARRLRFGRALADRNIGTALQAAAELREHLRTLPDSRAWRSLQAASPNIAWVDEKTPTDVDLQFSRATLTTVLKEADLAWAAAAGAALRLAPTQSTPILVYDHALRISK